MNNLESTLVCPDVENTIIGSCLCCTKVMNEAFDYPVRPEYFYTLENQKLFSIMLEMHYNGDLIDVVTVNNTYPGHEVFLSELTESQSTHPYTTIKSYFDTLIEKYRFRQAYEKGCNLQKAAIDNNSDCIHQLIQESLQTGQDEKLPEPVWGSHYIEYGIPERKPELISGILRRSHKLLIGAPSKACKSFLAIRLALAIAHGREFLGFPCCAGKVFVVNCEIDEGSYLHHVKAVAESLGWAMPENIMYYHLRGYGNDIEILLPAIAQKTKGHDFTAIIFDPQYKLLRSSKIRNFSENDSAAMAYLYGELDRYFARNNISPIIISHFAKGTAAFKESIDRIAGSGAPMRDVDALITLSALDSEDSYRMEFSLREFKSPEPISLQWKYPVHTIDSALDGVSLKKHAGRPGAATGADDDAVFKTVQGLNGTATQHAVRTALSGKVGRYRVVEALERLIISGILNTSKGEKNAIVYHIV